MTVPLLPCFANLSEANLHQLARLYPEDTTTGKAVRAALAHQVPSSSPVPTAASPEDRRERKRTRRRVEHAEQCAVVAWAAEHVSVWPDLELLHAVQNWAGVKGPREGAARQAEGVRPGVPDLDLPVPRGGYLGLRVEMKAQYDYQTADGRAAHYRGKLSAEQQRWGVLLTRAGHCVRVCYSAGEAQAVLAAYLRGELLRGRASEARRAVEGRLPHRVPRAL